LAGGSTAPGGRGGGGGAPAGASGSGAGAAGAVAGSPWLVVDPGAGRGAGGFGASDWGRRGRRRGCLLLRGVRKRSLDEIVEAERIDEIREARTRTRGRVGRYIVVVCVGREGSDWI